MGTDRVDNNNDGRDDRSEDAGPSSYSEARDDGNTARSGNSPGDDDEGGGVLEAILKGLGAVVWEGPQNAVGGALWCLNGFRSGTVQRGCWFMKDNSGFSPGDFQFYGDYTPGISEKQKQQHKAHEDRHNDQSDVAGPLLIPAYLAGLAVECCTLGLVENPAETDANKNGGDPNR